jgi:acid stress-induced BolA-like protein IbaG/YrbA
MEQRVKDIIESALEGAHASTERLYGGRVFGRVIWSGFEGMDDVDRQQMLRDLLAEKLGQDIFDVGILITYTPRELEIMSAA